VKVDQSEQVRVDLPRETWDRIFGAADEGVKHLSGRTQAKALEGLEALAEALADPPPAGGTELIVAIVFDRAFSAGESEEFVRVLAAELEFRDSRDHRYHDPGWGIGRSRVIRVERAKAAS
jgi:hypothetical protein